MTSFSGKSFHKLIVGTSLSSPVISSSFLTKLGLLIPGFRDFVDNFMNCNNVLRIQLCRALTAN